MKKIWCVMVSVDGKTVPYIGNPLVRSEAFRVALASAHEGRVWIEHLHKTRQRIYESEQECAHRNTYRSRINVGHPRT